jgi:uncharacterized RDD family membrane protein YckC
LRAKLGEGVYYAREDCAGIGKRFLIWSIDLVVIAIGLTFIAVSCNLLVVRHDPAKITFLLSMGFIYLYLTVLKASPVRTVGYILCNARIVTLRGKRPSLLRMTFRLLLWVFGPFNIVYDMIWVGVDDDRQGLRDRFAGTYVICSTARPAGRGPIHVAYYFAFGWTLTFPKVTGRTPCENGAHGD